MADAVPIVTADYTKYYIIGGIAVALIGGFVVYKFVIKKPATSASGAKLGVSAPGTDGNGRGASTSTTDTNATSISGTGSATSGSSSSTTSSQGNDYVGSDVLGKISSGNYTKYDASDTVADMPGYMKSISDNLGLEATDKGIAKALDVISKKRKKKLAQETQAKITTAEPYVRGFFKGLNLAARQDYVGIFAPYIKTYLSNAAKLPYTQVTVGQFLTA